MQNVPNGQGDIPQVTPDSLVGVWRRRSIRWPDGREDTTPIVFWVQGQDHFADIRIPAGRPSFAGITGFGDCRKEHLEWMATQQGFAGTLHQVAEDTWRWIRVIDYQPPAGGRDIGRLRFLDQNAELMIEEGVDEPYVEIWERLSARETVESRAVSHMQIRATNWELFVAAGDHFLLAIDHRLPLDPAASLLDVTRTSRHPPQALLNMELSFGTRTPNAPDGIVTHSTFPWREGQRLHPDHFGRSS